MVQKATSDCKKVINNSMAFRITLHRHFPFPRFLRRSPPLFKVSTFHFPLESVKKHTSVLGLRAMTTVSASGLSSDVGDVLGEVSIFTAAGDAVKFKDLWDQNEGVVVVALLRHFGCICCWELASSLKESKAKFDSFGVKLIAVGVGPPEKARILADRLPFPMDCLYCDPNRKAYDVLGLYYGLGRTLFNGHIVNAFLRRNTLNEEVKKNYTIKAIPNLSSGLQQGGMFVFKGKELLYARKDEGTGDHAPLGDVFDVCSKIAVS